MENKGLKIAVFLMCFSLSVNILGGIGFANLAGEDVTPGLGGEKANDDPAIQNPSGGETGDNTGFLAYAVGAVDTVKSLGFLIAGTYDALIAVGAPSEIAIAVQTVVDVAFAIGIAAIVRGMRF